MFGDLCKDRASITYNVSKQGGLGRNCATYTNEVEMCRNQRDILSAGEGRWDLDREVLVRWLVRGSTIVAELGIVWAIVENSTEVLRWVVAGSVAAFG